MKVIMVMAVTPNGYIARENDDTSWVTKEDWKRFKDISKKIGCVIIGRRTYEAVIAESQFPLPGRLNVVVTHEKIENKWGEDKVIFTGKSPKDILEMLKKKGFKKACVAGGGINNANFMKQGLIDEILVDVEPTIFGKGIKLFADADFDLKLKLLKVKKLSKNELQLHYKVLK